MLTVTDIFPKAKPISSPRLSMPVLRSSQTLHICSLGPILNFLVLFHHFPFAHATSRMNKHTSINHGDSIFSGSVRKSEPEPTHNPKLPGRCGSPLILASHWMEYPCKSKQGEYRKTNSNGSSIHINLLASLFALASISDPGTSSVMGGKNRDLLFRQCHPLDLPEKTSTQTSPSSDDAQRRPH